MRYRTEQRTRFHAIAISRLRDHFEVEIRNGHRWTPDPRNRTRGSSPAAPAPQKRLTPRAGRLW